MEKRWVAELRGRGAIAALLTALGIQLSVQVQEGRFADAEIASMAPPGSPREALAEQVAVGVATSEAAFSALRALAQEDASARRYGGSTLESARPADQ